MPGKSEPGNGQGRPADDEQDPSASAEVVPREQAMREVKEPEEKTATSPGLPTTGATPDASTLWRFITFYPCMRFFMWTAHRQYPRSHNPETRVKAMRDDHRGFYRCCVFFDFVFVLLSGLVLLAAIAGVLYKTIWVGP